MTSQAPECCPKPDLEDCTLIVLHCDGVKCIISDSPVAERSPPRACRGVEATDKRVAINLILDKSDDV